VHHAAVALDIYGFAIFAQPAEDVTELVDLATQTLVNILRDERAIAFNCDLEGSHSSISSEL